MCDKCDEIDKTILRYRNIQRRVLDQMLIDDAQKLIDELVSKKVEYQPDQPLQ